VVKDIKAKATNDVLVLDAGDQFTGTGGLPPSAGRTHPCILLPACMPDYPYTSMDTRTMLTVTRSSASQ
jgi:hypothetical protein